jgi:hypothetical protein
MSKQEASINLFYNSLVDMAGSITVERVVERIEGNMYNDAAELSDDNFEKSKLDNIFDTMQLWYN